VAAAHGVVALAQRCGQVGERLQRAHEARADGDREAAAAGDDRERQRQPRLEIEVAESHQWQRDRGGDRDGEHDQREDRVLMTEGNRSSAGKGPRASLARGNPRGVTEGMAPAHGPTVPRRRSPVEPCGVAISTHPVRARQGIPAIPAFNAFHASRPPQSRNEDDWHIDMRQYRCRALRSICAMRE